MHSCRQVFHTKHSQHFFNIRECEMNNVSWRDCFRALVDMMPSELGPGNNQPGKSDRSHHINPDQSQGHWHQRTNVTDKHVSWIDSKYDFGFVRAVVFWTVRWGEVRQGWGEISWRDCMPSLEGCRVMSLWLGHSVPDDWAWCTLTQTHMHTLSWGWRGSQWCCASGAVFRWMGCDNSPARRMPGQGFLFFFFWRVWSDASLVWRFSTL